MIKIVLAILFFSLNSLQGKEEKVFRIGIVPWIAWTPLYVAEELGFWKDLGINVEIINYANIREKINSFIHDKTVLSLGEPSDFLPLLEKGYSLKILICIDCSLGADKFIIRKGLKKDEIKGKRIAISSYPAGDFFIERGLKNLKIDPKSLIYINVDSPTMAAEAFLNGKVDGAYIYPPSSFIIENKGNAEILFDSSKFPVYEIIVCKTQLVEKESFALQKILMGWFKAVAWSLREENLNRFHEIAKRRMYFRRTNYELENFKKTMKEIKIFSKPSEIEEVNRKGGKCWEYFKGVVGFSVRKNYISSKIAPADVMEQKIWKNSMKEVFK